MSDIHTKKYNFWPHYKIQLCVNCVSAESLSPLVDLSKYERCLVRMPH